MTPRAVFHVNANAVDYVKQIAAHYECLRRGELFKFKAGAPILGLWFLPEDIMQGLRDYDWQQHGSQLEQWLSQRDEVIGGASRILFRG